MAGYSGFNKIDHWIRGLSLEKATAIQEYFGLENEGSTCYLNSVLQMLFMTKEFRQHVLNMSSDLSGDNFIEELKKLVFLGIPLHLPQKTAVSAAEVRKSLGITDVDKQRDAAEHLHLIIRKTPGSSEFFKGTMKTTRTCLECFDEHESFENFLSLIVSFKDSQDVGTAVNAHIGQMCGEYEMNCLNCKSNTDWERESEIDFPKILIIQLRRFEMMSPGLIYSKNDLKVNILPLIEVSSVNYDLYAIINHSGSHHAGHYYADIKCEDETWRRFEDESVSESPINIFFRYVGFTLSSDAYLLVYRR